MCSKRQGEDRNLVITGIRHYWPEKKGFNLRRTIGLPEYTFLHLFGSVTLTVNGEAIHTEPHAVIILKPDTPYGIYSPDGDLIHDWFHFTGDDADTLISGAGLRYNTVYYPKTDSFITDTVKLMEKEYFGGEAFSDEISAAYTDILFKLIARALKPTASEISVDAGTEERFKKLRARIFSNLDRTWTVSDMAAEVNLSESRVYTLYKAIFSTTPNQDLILARMDLGKRLLSQENFLSVSDVASECGYTNEFHFIRQFKKHVGITPKQYAIRNREK